MAEKKNRPTPKRREVEKTKSAPRLAPASSKEAKKAQRAQSRALRVAQRDAYLRGEESALPLRDRGPVKRFVRNYVDSRRTVGEYFLVIIIPTMFMAVFPVLIVRLAGGIILYGVLFLSIINGFLLSRKIKKEVAIRFPEAPTKGLGVYAWLRSTQMRRMRAPLPQVKRGEQI
ncbi:MAG: hypothetical protein RLZZ251_79 [Actinomycetota bacterium]|jgi:hypothetical protein